MLSSLKYWTDFNKFWYGGKYIVYFKTNIVFYPLLQAIYADQTTYIKMSFKIDQTSNLHFRGKQK